MSLPPLTDTIYALASGSMHAGVAVVRVSGSRALHALQALSGRQNHAARMTQLSTLKDDQGQLLDRALTVYFKAPASFTGEDVVELHLHGGRAVIEGVLHRLSEMDGLRPAEAGEFTKRAFENGKLDLTAAEAIADLIDAQTQAQRAQALDQLGGTLSTLYQGWTDALTKLLAHQEADIEFPDEDLPQGLSPVLIGDLEKLGQEIAAHLDDKRRGEILRDGIRVAIIGAPNAGKSTLLNALAQRDAAIVSAQAGTTRDVIEVRLDLGGYPVIVADTAGLRETDDAIESEGIRRAEKAAREADIRLALFDSACARDEKTQAIIDPDTIVVLTKSDTAHTATEGGIAVSARTGEGVNLLVDRLTARIAEMFSQSRGPSPTRARHRAALESALTHIKRGITAQLPELAAEDMRQALRDLGRITGRVHVEELLDRIFKDFCIGK